MCDFQRERERCDLYYQPVTLTLLPLLLASLSSFQLYFSSLYISQDQKNVAFLLVKILLSYVHRQKHNHVR